MPQKNDVFKTEITDVNHMGLGVCRTPDGIVCFVKNAVTNDNAEVKVIKANKNYCIGRLEKLISPSEYRTETNCRVFKSCGGCTFRHIDYSYELVLKKSFVMLEFKKAGLEVEVNDVLTAGNISNYRNKAQYPVDKNGRLGFYASRSHDICENSDCALQDEIFSRILSKIKDFIRSYNIRGYDETCGKGLLRHIYLRAGKATGEIMICLVINGDDLPHKDKLISALEEFPEVVSIMLNINRKKTNVITGDKYICIAGKEYIEDILCGLRFRISPASFYQVNHDGAELLYTKAAELVKSGEHKNIVDLYCGAGTIGLCIAKQTGNCSLVGIEIVEEAIENARLNAQLNGIENARFICSDSGEADEDILRKTDVVILDPPRKGVSPSLIEKISDCKVRRIVYVSCSPDTLARDIKLFTEKGYICDKVTPVDMFPRTGHVECVTHLYRK